MRSQRTGSAGRAGCPCTPVRATQGRLSALSVFHRKLILYEAFVWESRALNGLFRRFPARADGKLRRTWDAVLAVILCGIGLVLPYQIGFQIDQEPFTVLW